MVRAGRQGNNWAGRQRYRVTTGPLFSLFVGEGRAAGRRLESLLSLEPAGGAGSDVHPLVSPSDSYSPARPASGLGDGPCEAHCQARTGGSSDSQAGTSVRPMEPHVFDGAFSRIESLTYNLFHFRRFFILNRQFHLFFPPLVPPPPLSPPVSCILNACPISSLPNPPYPQPTVPPLVLPSNLPLLPLCTLYAQRAPPTPPLVYASRFLPTPLVYAFYTPPPPVVFVLRLPPPPSPSLCVLYRCPPTLYTLYDDP